MSEQPNGFADKVAFSWSVADLLRGDFKLNEYGHVILPFTVLRRLECAIVPTREQSGRHLPASSDSSLDHRFKRHLGKRAPEPVLGVYKIRARDGTRQKVTLRREGLAPT